MKPSLTHKTTSSSRPTAASAMALELVERIFVVIGFIIASGAVIPLLTNAESGQNVFSPAYMATLVAFYSLTLLFALPYMKRISAILVTISPLLLSFLLYQFAQIAWLDDPLMNARGAIAAFMTTIFAVYVVSRFTTETYFPLLLIAFGIIVITSILFVQFIPSIAYQPPSWTWRGAFINRNALGTYSALAAILFFIGFLCYRPLRFVCAGMMMICLFTLVKTQSKTALVAMVGSVGLTILTLYLHRLDVTRRVLVFLFCLTVGGTGFFFLVVAPEILLEALGRQSNLSGRTDAWQVVVSSILDKPILGHGTLRLDGELLAPHNMWLTIWLKNGLIGLLLFLFFFSSSFARNLTGSINSGWPGCFLFPAFFSFVFIRGFMEGLYFSTLLWVLLVMSATTPFVRKRYDQMTSYVLTSIVILLICAAAVVHPVSKALQVDTKVHGSQYKTFK